MSETPLQDQTIKYLPLVLEIRNRLLFLASLFVATSLLGFIFYEKIIRFILSVFRFEGVNIVFTSPFQSMTLAINSSFTLAFTVILPFITFQLLSFLRPALRAKEYRTVVMLLPLSLVLFIGGFTYGIMIMKYTVQLFYQQSQGLGIGNFLDISSFLSLTLLTAILLGLAFQFPLVMTLLLHFKVVKHNFIAKKRLFFHAGALIFAALLPPTDLLSLILMFLPLALLFELTLILNRIIFKPEQRKEEKNV